MASYDEKSQILKYIEDRNSYSASQTEIVQVKNQDIFKEILELSTEYNIFSIDTEHETTSHKKVDRPTVEKRKLIVKGFDETLKQGVIKNKLVQKFKEIGKLDGNPFILKATEDKPPAAILVYFKPESASKAIEEFNGKEMMEIGATSLQVELKKVSSKSLETQVAKQDVALLQISFPNGKCFLLNHRLNLPKKFLDILENPEILKIGIGLPGDDKGRIKSQWNIEPKGLVDIRHVVRKFNPQAVANKNGAEHLAKEILGIKLDFKDDWKFHEKWESENLNENQIKYAANDVLTAMAIILKVTNERDSTHQDVSIDDVIKSTYDACLQFVDKDYRGAKNVGDKQKSDKVKEKSVKTTKLVELLKTRFPGEPEKVGRITGALKRSRNFKIEDLEKMLVDGKDDGIEFVKAKIQEVQEMQDGKNFKTEIMAEDAASADVFEKLEDIKIGNEGLKKTINDLKAMILKLEIRIASLEK